MSMKLKSGYAISKPCILRQVRNEYGKNIRKEYEKGMVKEQRHNIKEWEPRTDGISNTISTVQKDNYLIEPKIHKLCNLREGASGMKDPSVGRVYGTDGIAPSILSRDHKDPKLIAEAVAKEIQALASAKQRKQCGVTICKDGAIRPYLPDAKKGAVAEYCTDCATSTAGTVIAARPNLVYGDDTAYRIRKLTPGECFRLMGVSDDDIDKIQSSGISKTQQYKLAGNSIVVDVMAFLFDKLFKNQFCLEPSHSEISGIQKEPGDVRTIGYYNKSRYNSSRIIDPSGIAPVVMGNHGTVMAVPEKIGNIYPSGGQNGNIYSIKGISPTIASGTGCKGNGIGSNNAPKILESTTPPP